MASCNNWESPAGHCQGAFNKLPPASAGIATYSDISHDISLAAGDAIEIEIKNNATAASALITRAVVQLTY